MTTVTQQEWNVLTFIQSYQERYGVAPKLNDIRHALRLESKQRTNDIVYSLVCKNLVRRYGRRHEGDGAQRHAALPDRVRHR